MTRSTDRILTTHVGSLPRPAYLLPTLYAKTRGEAYDPAAHEKALQTSINDVVRRQVECGMDIVNDGEHDKSSFAAYTHLRLGGFEPVPAAARTAPEKTRDMIAFPDVYRQMDEASEKIRATRQKPRAQEMRCVAPVTYTGLDELNAGIARLKTALNGLNPADAFITALSPTNVERRNPNVYYKTQEEYLFALADAMRVEFKAIVDAGFQVQVDDPRLVSHYDRSPNATLAEVRKVMALHVEVTNHSLKGIPEDRVRFHTCYSVNVAPRAHDMELKDYVDLMLKINASSYSFEGANPRHEHEWQVWEDVKLPQGKVLLPGVVSHCVYQVEHPELVAQRIERFAKFAGRENVIASTDCGFATAAAGDEVHPDVAWAKLSALSDGAALASKRLWAR